MYVVSESEQRTTVTPAGAMSGLAGPSQGSTEISTWRVELGAGASTPVHIIDLPVRREACPARDGRHGRGV
ncbi:hypothetical protein AB0C60_34015, partial [Streptomyces sp. NPDC048845]